MTAISDFFTWATKERRVTLKHLAGEHDQSTHGGGAAFSDDESVGYATGTENSETYRHIKENYIDAAANRRDWSKLPSDMEFNAVKRVREEIKPFVKNAIKGRISIAKANTFEELKDGFYKATMEMEGKLNKVKK